MLNKKSISDVNRSTFSNEFRKPLYDSYCFSNIPGTIEKLLTGHTTEGKLPDDTTSNKEYDKVILFFVDAFGWRFFERYQDKYPTLKRFVDDGIVSKITSQFPSTTAAHVTTIHTGKSVDQSGIFEWYYYEPKLDMMIAPLLFSKAGDHERGTLTGIIEPSQIYPNHSFYEKLAEKDINTYLFQSADYTPTPYGNVVTKGVKNVNAYGNVKSALSDLSNAVIQEDGKAYYYFYYGDIDGAGHEFGPDSLEFENVASDFFENLEKSFINLVKGQCGKTLMLMTADHGQTNTDPATTIYLNKVLPEIINWTKTNKQGELLVVGGSCRDMFLYIKDEYLGLALSTLRELLKEVAEVYLVEDLIAQGFLGSNPSEELRGRIGNICVLPFKNNSVFWLEEGKFKQKFYGHHGGLTAEEMDTIFLSLEL